MFNGIFNDIEWTHLNPENSKGVKTGNFKPGEGDYIITVSSIN